MQRVIRLFASLLVLLLVSTTFAAGTTPVAPTRNKDLLDLYKHETSTLARADLFEVTIEPYYDPILAYDKTGFGPQQGQFAYQSVTGLSGLQMLFTLINHAGIELSTGFDYTFTQTVQGAQTPAIFWATGTNITSQQVSMMGIKLLQVGYRIPANTFTVIPYAGFGIYYGKNVLQLSGYAGPDTVTYSKLFATLGAGARLEYNLFKEVTIGVSVEAYEPIKFADQLSQNGTGVLVGSDDILKSNVDFAFSFGGRVLASIGYVF